MSLVAHIQAEDISLIEAEVAKIDGLEILDVVDDQQKMLLLLDIEDDFAFNDALKQLQQLKYFHSLSYAAHYSEDAIAK
ncbi:MAG: hypothetical protein ACK5MJ_06345 [Alphaproteobacteria bacterium]